jgi:hypothetical protein
MFLGIKPKTNFIDKSKAKVGVPKSSEVVAINWIYSNVVTPVKMQGYYYYYYYYYF